MPRRTVTKTPRPPADRPGGSDAETIREFAERVRSADPLVAQWLLRLARGDGPGDRQTKARHRPAAGR